MRGARAHAAICIAPPHGTPLITHAVVIRSRSVHQLRAAEIRGAHVGVGGGDTRVGSAGGSKRGRRG
eukprot:153640-Prymnesium_polylepis.1